MSTLGNYITTKLGLPIYRKQLLLQSCMVVSVLLIATAVAYKGTPGQLQALFLMFAALLAAPIIVRLPGLSLILTLIGGVFVKYSGPSGLNITMVGIAGLFGVWLAKMIIVDRQIRWISSKAIPPILAFILISTISFGIGLLPFVPYANQAPIDAQIGGYAIFMLSAAAFLATAHLLNMRWVEWFTWAFIAVGASYIFSWATYSMGLHRLHLFDNSVTNNSMLYTWLIALAFSQAWFNKRIHLIWRFLLGVLILLNFYLAYGQANDWKSGWVPPLVAIFAILGFRYWKFALFLVPFGFVAAVIAAIQIIGTDTYSWGTRVDAWVIVIAMVKVSPIFGMGFANYYWYARYFPIRGWYVPFNSHNQYIDIIAQTGVVGMACFLWIFWEIGRLGWKLRNIAPEGFTRAYVYGVLGGIVATLVAAGLADWVLPFTYNVGFKGFRASVLPWIFMGGLVCVEQLVRQQSEHQKVKVPGV